MLDQHILKSYGFGYKMRVTTAVSLLGWVGIIISSQALIGGFFLVIVPSSLTFNDDIYGDLSMMMPKTRDLSMMMPKTKTKNPAIITFGVVLFILSLALLILNIILIQRNRAGTFIGVKRILRILCYFWLSLQLIAIFAILIIIIRFKIAWHKDSAILALPIFGALVQITLSSIGIHGVRMTNKRLLNVYIIYTFINMMISLVSVLFSLIGFYNFGLFVVLYNMIGVSEDEGRDMRHEYFVRNV